MQLTRAADYGIRVMMHVASLPAGGRANASELAEATDVPPSFMAKILQRLAAARLLVSYRGRDGGFELAVPAAELSLLDVVNAFEDTLCLNACLAGSAGCNRRSWCAAHLVWAEAQAMLAKVLSSASLDRLAHISATRRANLG